MSKELQKADDEETQMTTMDTSVLGEVQGATLTEDSTSEPRDINIGDESLPLAQELGTTGSIEQDMNKKAIRDYLAEDIYDSNSAFVREYNQNGETAGVRAAKLAVANHQDYGKEWLTRKLWVNSETGDTVADATETDRQTILAEYDGIEHEHLRKIEIPRPVNEVVAAARSIGFDPTIEIKVYHDEQKIVYQDNGIGMSADEVQNAFNTIANSGVRYEGDTGGAKGVGALTFKNVTGKEGSMTVATKTRRPDVPDFNHEGIRFYAYLGAIKELPNDEIRDDFYGTRFEIPVQDDFNLHNMTQWVAQYAHGLRVPVLYKEYRDGECNYEEEYGGQGFFEMFDDPLIQIERPGEFKLAAGPDVDTRGNKSNCYLISMPIDRNIYSPGGTLWNVVVRFDDEQGRIVHGPNRGKHRHEMDSLHPDDIALSEPTSDRDRLKKGDKHDQLWNWLYSLVKEEEMQIALDFMDTVVDNDHVWEAIREDPEGWDVFTKLVNKHGPYNVTRSAKKIKKFFENRTEFEADDDDLWEEMVGMWKSFSFAPQGNYGITKKSGRRMKELGNILADSDPEHVFMGQRINEDKCKVVWNTYDDGGVIQVDTENYEDLQEQYGFKLLKNVPTRQSDEHDFDVPDKMEARKSISKKSDDDDDDKPTDVESRRLKIRTINNSDIDYRKTVGEIREYLEKGKTLGGHRNLILFPRTGENISNNYKWAKHAMIASCINAEFEALHDLDNVYTKQEFIDEAMDTAIATTEGGMTARELMDVAMDDTDRRVALLMVNSNEEKMVVTDEYEVPRNEIMKTSLEERVFKYPGDGERPTPDDFIVGVVDQKTYNKAKPAFDTEYLSNDLFGIRVGRWRTKIINTYRFDNTFAYYKRMMETPMWDNDSDVYRSLEKMSNKSWIDTDLLEATYYGLHDRGLTPDEMDPDTLRKLIEKA